MKAAVALMFGAFACEAHPTRAAPAPVRPEIDVPHTSQKWVGPPLPRARLILTDVYGGRHPVDVEVAATEPMRERGMMWRKELPEGKGMLFVFPHEEEHSFWMRNTLIPLDMIFIDAAGAIVGIVNSAEPGSLVSRSIGARSKYVLEVPGGWSAKIGVRAGDRADLQDVARFHPQ